MNVGGGKLGRGMIGRLVVLRRLALVSLVANVVIVVTGGAVRLTGSGLGCPTWPHCDGGSYVTTPAMGYHGVIEFTNRTLTGVVGVLAGLCVLSALLVASPSSRSWRTLRPGASRTSRDLDGSRIRWATLVLLSIPAQAVLGGITVLTDLNPWIVACHFLLSVAVIWAAYQLWIRTREVMPAEPAGPAVRALAQVIVAVTAAVLTIGTVVTGSGPHAGDDHARRTGLDLTSITQLHTDLVMLLIGLSVAAWFALRAAGAPARAVSAALVLIAIECGQALIGFVQYFTKIPAVLVGAHMLGACLVWIAALGLMAAARPPVVATADHDPIAGAHDDRVGVGSTRDGVPAARTPERA